MDITNIFHNIFLSLLAGMLPALLWLWFWLHEDRLHPEPWQMLLFSFVGGMVAVLIAIPLEEVVYHAPVSAVSIVIGWAAIEEILKFLAAYYIALRTSVNDEPVDTVIYLITAALGFAALENTLFLYPSIASGSAVVALFTANLRFIGATLLHLAASSSIGVALALSFYKPKSTRRKALFLGLAVAILLHSLFNLFIIQGTSSGVLITFSVVWLALIVLILLIEKIKRVKNGIIKIN